MISFLLNDKRVDITESDADRTLLEYLREEQGLTGTKEGCASGDCGACTLVTAQLNESGDGLEYKSINSCITFLGALHGKQLITVEHLSDNHGLHPVQQAMVDAHGSQCGFCTPGFIMSMFALYHQDIQVDHQSVEIALSGNLCRCTGYRPIIDATISSCSQRRPDKFDQRADTTCKELAAIPPSEGITGMYTPQNRQQLAAVKSQHPDARLVAGSTDLALEVTQQLKSIEKMISVSRVKELNELSEDETHIHIGSAVTLSALEPVLLKHFPSLSELLWRFASTPIRNQATLGGNVANASPIGDMPPVLLALNAIITLDNGNQTRSVPASGFFLDYRKTALERDEWIASVSIPKLTANQILKAYKVSKRHEDDISAVCGVFLLTLDEGTVAEIRTGFGGVAATPVSCDALSDELNGLEWASQDTLNTAKRILAQAFSPLSDVRASAEYRNQICANLIHRLWLETSNKTIETRVVNYA